ncbi:5-(carboxyamino)imidazole ribonucleotide synthase [Thiomicrorhabdus heinhorstiae]|uniref:N5-carboxyaminoimidazole ribonucleotide synthase n=1 Tax=Thiomicrorhabdus heinhorstiae TaxID=2748010 RepID=A0ABS0BVH0_9GAMM|nr:5-(carboxyamino)imidazole ribonucleotide synthase [Thiomicrorhabdus heinhorstiae]MBF6057823.1 5-(carboxyamino)imidazole ribonucleotide synthase [Thiomicrorhabdus heinhorstiae]
MTPISKRVGVLGAGQLGRMLAIAGYPLGQKFGFYGMSDDEPSALLGHMHKQSDDTDSLQKLVDFADVITYESENTDVETVRKISQTTPVYPGEKSLFVTQHRGREKGMFDQLEIPCASYRIVDSLESLQLAVDEIGVPAILKTTTEGYDGKGQFVLKEKEQIDEAWKSIGGRELILEGFVEFHRELSIVAVRNANNEHVYYPLVQNVHHEGILRYTIAPAREVSEEIQQQAELYMQKLLDELDHVGVLTLELFETTDGLVANEMAPRVHNSGHWTIEGALTSQFENHIRAICGLPLGSTEPRQPLAAMINIIGETGPVEKVLTMDNVFLHLYDKAERKGRKLGHINLIADDEESLFSLFKELSDFLPK